MPSSFVTPSTSEATSSPNRSLDLGRARRRVLDGVVQQRRAQRLGVEPQARADLRDADRMDDELLARLAPLVGVMAAGEEERRGHAVAVDRQRGLVGVLLDDREEVGEQALRGRREVCDRRRDAAVAVGPSRTASTGDRVVDSGAASRGRQAASAIERVSHARRSWPSSSSARYAAERSRSVRSRSLLSTTPARAASTAGEPELVHARAAAPRPRGRADTGKLGQHIALRRGARAREVARSARRRC